LDVPVPVDPREKRELGRRALRVFEQQYDERDTSGIVLNVSTPPRPGNEPKIPWYLAHSTKVVLLGEPRSSAEKTVDFTDNVDTPVELENPTKRHYLDLKQIDAYPIHIAGLQREDSIVPPEFRGPAIELLKQKEDEARTRLRARGVLDITSAANSLRTA
jgi:hypothetical protein